LSDCKIDGENAEQYTKSEKYDANNNYLKFAVNQEESMVATPSN